MENRPVYSAEITEIIGTPPRWIIRAGGGLLLGVFLASLGVASVVRVPEQNSSPVLISGTTQPYYVRQVAGGRRTAASGQVVRQGQLLVRGTAVDVPAPFAGRLLLQDQPTAASPGDTIGLLLPLRNTYRFNGTVDLALADKLTGSRALPIQVKLNDQADGQLLLHGHLGYIKPVVRNGHVSYVGQLDSLSNARLARHLAAVTNLAGAVLFTSTRKPLLQSLFE